MVEDEAITAIDLEQLLGELGYAVTGTARSATEAIIMAETGRPDLALMDIRLDQGTDGVEAAREIRDRFAIPSVFLTSHSDAATFQRAHAIANGIFVAAVNRIGFEGPPDSGIEFWGNSFVADPFGQVIAQASTDKEETLIVECDPRRMEEVRRNWPFLRDRRTDAYAPLLERWLD